jgi:hypothetical protein
MEQEAFLTHILVMNNVVPLVLGDYVIARKKHKRSGKLTFYDSCHVTSSNGYHLRCHACKLSHLRCYACMSCHQSNRGKPQWIRAWHMDFTWIHGPTRAPKPPQEQLYTGDRLKGPQDSHLEEAHPEWRPPGIDWTNLGSVDPGPPRGACPLVVESIPVVFHSFLCWCSGL